MKKLVPLLEQLRDDCAAISAIVDEHLQQVRSRIAELHALEIKLRACRTPVPAAGRCELRHPA